MLVTFKTNAYSDITMFGSPATALLKLMGQSGNVPGAIMADDVPDALRQLNEGLAKLSAQSNTDVALETKAGGYDDEEQEPTVGLDKRAGPLVTLLEAAVAANENVLWES